MVLLILNSYIHNVVFVLIMLNTEWRKRKRKRLEAALFREVEAEAEAEAEAVMKKLMEAEAEAEAVKKKSMEAEAEAEAIKNCRFQTLCFPLLALCRLFKILKFRQGSGPERDDVLENKGENFRPSVGGHRLFKGRYGLRGWLEA